MTEFEGSDDPPVLWWADAYNICPSHQIPMAATIWRPNSAGGIDKALICPACAEHVRRQAHKPHRRKNLFDDLSEALGVGK
jgi:hypothetical protein